LEGDRAKRKGLSGIPRYNDLTSVGGGGIVRLERSSRIRGPLLLKTHGNDWRKCGSLSIRFDSARAGRYVLGSSCAAGNFNNDRAGGGPGRSHIPEQRSTRWVGNLPELLLDAHQALVGKPGSGGVVPPDSAGRNLRHRRGQSHKQYDCVCTERGYGTHRL